VFKTLRAALGQNETASTKKRKAKSAVAVPNVHPFGIFHPFVRSIFCTSGNGPLELIDIYNRFCESPAVYPGPGMLLRDQRALYSFSEKQSQNKVLVPKTKKKGGCAGAHPV